MTVTKTLVPGKCFVLQLVLATATALSGFGADPVVGTWRLDTAHSKFRPGPPPKSEIRTYTESSGGVSVKITTVDANGEIANSEYPTNFDGKDYVQPGSDPGDTVALTKNSEYHASAVLKHAGKILVNVERSISADGKTMTITYQGTTARGDPVANTSIYEKVEAGTRD